MAFRHCSLALALLVTAACGGGSGSDAGPDAHPEDDAGPDVDGGRPDGAADTGVDGGDDAGRDASGDGGICSTWTLMEVPSERIDHIDPVPVSTERSTRVMLTTSLSGCDERAQPRVEIDPGLMQVRVAARVWRQNGVDCPATTEMVTRPVVLLLGSTGTWSVLDVAAGSSASARITVGAAPTGFDCTRDADCAAGERCLGGTGLGGPFASCAVPCELDRDCNGSRCTSPDDGLEYACERGGSECSGTSDCPDGFACSSGTCTPSFELGTTGRVECTCDSDCEPGLSCVEPATDGGARRCEARCRSGDFGTNVWCSGPHWCVPADADVSGLAATDAVCGWVGE